MYFMSSVADSCPTIFLKGFMWMLLHMKESPVLKEPAGVATVACDDPLEWAWEGNVMTLFHPEVFGEGTEIFGYHQTPKPPEHNMFK